jgi:hypothetical protein
MQDGRPRPARHPSCVIGTRVVDDYHCLGYQAGERKGLIHASEAASYPGLLVPGGNDDCDNWSLSQGRLG